MEKCVYDYQNSCTCAEDDKCGCDFDNNMAHDFTCYFDKNMLNKNKNLKQPFDIKPQNHLPRRNQS